MSGGKTSAADSTAAINFLTCGIVTVTGLGESTNADITKVFMRASLIESTSERFSALTRGRTVEQIKRQNFLELQNEFVSF